MSIRLGISFGDTQYTLAKSCGKGMGSKTHLDKEWGDMVLTILSSSANPSQNTKLSTDVNNPVYRNFCDL
jgi:hypothetical protein